MRVVISSGHGAKVRGASGYIDEVDEARLVVESVADALRESGVEVTTYHDDVSNTQSENLDRIVDFHNSKTRDLDISVHFNAYQTTQKPMGCEVLYVSSTGMEIADVVVDRICDVSGLINRGPKKRTDLAFLNGTEEPAILIETCFVDSKADVEIYEQNYNVICSAIADAISGEDHGEPIPPEIEGEPDDGILFNTIGTCSTFGGPADTGVSPSEGLAMWHQPDECPWLMLEHQPSGTTGMARRLDPAVFYIACRWNYDVTSKEMLRGPQMAMVTNPDTGVQRLAHVADWGPHEEQTGRAADLSPALAESLGVVTNDVVVVIYPYLPATPTS